MRLPASVRAWGAPDFARVLKGELERLPPGTLPLQQALVATSVALDDAPTVMVIGASERDRRIQARVGVFFSGLVAGCSCADDPTPVEPHSEYCEILLVIDPTTAEACATLADAGGD